MKEYKEGEKSKGICENCKEIVTTTFRYDTLRYNDKINIPNILIASCDICKAHTSIPHSESIKIKRYLDEIQ